MPRIGSGVRPELGRQDWSPIARGGQAFGAGIGAGFQALGAGIGKSIAKQQAQKENKQEWQAIVKAGKSQMKAIIDNPHASEEMKAVAQSQLDTMDNPEMSLKDQATIGARALTTVETIQELGAAELNRKIRAAELRQQKILNKALSKQPKYATAEEAKTAAERQGFKGISVYQMPDKTWTFRGETPESDEPAGVREYKYKLDQRKKMIQAVQSGNRDEAMAIAGALNERGPFGNVAATWQDLVDLYGVGGDMPRSESTKPIDASAVTASEEVPGGYLDGIEDTSSTSPPFPYRPINSVTGMPY